LRDHSLRVIAPVIGLLIFEALFGALLSLFKISTKVRKMSAARMTPKCD